MAGLTGIEFPFKLERSTCREPPVGAYRIRFLTSMSRVVRGYPGRPIDRRLSPHNRNAR